MPEPSHACAYCGRPNASIRLTFESQYRRWTRWMCRACHDVWNATPATTYDRKADA